MRNLPILLAALVTVWPLQPARAAPDHEPVQRIADAALAALDLGQGGQATVDPMLKVQRCPQPLATRITAARTVQVSCASAGWRVFVPVQVRNQQPVLVLRQPVAVGQVIQAGDLEQQPRDTARIAQAVLVDPAQAVGRTARRALQAGSLLSSGDLHAEKLVRRGAPVELVTRRGTVEIRVAARALRDGSVGDVLAVENLSTRRTVQGVVAADGTVVVR